MWSPNSIPRAALMQAEVKEESFSLTVFPWTGFLLQPRHHSTMNGNLHWCCRNYWDPHNSHGNPKCDLHFYCKKCTSNITQFWDIFYISKIILNYLNLYLKSAVYHIILRVPKIWLLSGRETELQASHGPIWWLWDMAGRHGHILGHGVSLETCAFRFQSQLQIWYCLCFLSLVFFL